jgi:membrane-bound lytic murein transglycosylase D
MPAMICALLLGVCGCQTAQKRKPLAAPAAVAPPTIPAGTGPATRSAAQTTAPAGEEAVVLPKADPVGALIAQVEKEYEAGQENYRAGHLEAARQDFDRAFNLLLQSPVPVQADERLQHEFDRIVDGVNGLEMVALERGDGFTEQESEPAPIDEANEVTFPVDPNVKAKAEAEIKATRSDLPLMMTDQVAAYISYFSTRGRGTLEHALTRAGRYQEMIHRIFKEEGVPQDLIYLAQAESGFHPLALSRAGARGMWQFMSSRARAYGLEKNWWLDDRQDPEKSTRAAARHLKDLYNQFGDWYLAMAAYNSGPGTVQSAVRRTGYADFWELYRRNVLPRETRNYVPIIVAVTIMAKNPSQYGLDHIIPEKPVLSDAVKIHYPVDLRLVAECVDASVSDLEDLNPSLLRLNTPKDGTFELHLPPGTRDKYLTAIGAIPENMRVWWRYHKVERGESLDRLARTYRTTARAIAQANHLAGDALEPHRKLIIPIAPGKQVPGETGDMYSRRATFYKVRHGDTVTSVAQEFGVPADRLRRWNRLKGGSLRAGRTLRIYLPVRHNAGESTRVANSGFSKPKSKLKKTSNGRVLHKVRQGETLTSIASSYNTTVVVLRRDNPKASAHPRVGDVLTVRNSR